RDVNVHIVTPGQLITDETQFMRGHGTFITDSGESLSSVAGVVERVNKLISVRALHSRYFLLCNSNVIDINSRQDAVLLLSAINLPGAAEVQGSFQDGSSSLHTRIPQALVQRCKTHFHTLPCGVDVTLGMNGYIWVSKHSDKTMEESDSELIYTNENEPIDRVTRENIARVCNCISILNRQFMCINDSLILYTYEASINYPVKELLKSEVMEYITTEVNGRVAMTKK
ncbi:16655_t:CDS:2, partial [Entrophospora sp. SA101]